jgi:hypothetical protein
VHTDHRQRPLSKRRAGRATLAAGADPPFETAVTRVPDADRLDAYAVAVCARCAVRVVGAVLARPQGGSALGDPAEDPAREPVLARISPLVTVAIAARGRSPTVSTRTAGDHTRSRRQALRPCPQGTHQFSPSPRVAAPIAATAATTATAANAAARRSAAGRRAIGPHGWLRRIRRRSASRRRAQSCASSARARRAGAAPSRIGPMSRGAVSCAEWRAGILATLLRRRRLSARYVSRLPRPGFPAVRSGQERLQERKGPCSCPDVGICRLILPPLF